MVGRNHAGTGQHSLYPGRQTRVRREQLFALGRERENDEVRGQKQIGEREFLARQI